MIVYKTGNIFESLCEIITVTVNCVGVMGAGIAKQCKQLYPATFAQYRRKCRKGEYHPGQPILTQVDRPILLFPTKDDWRNPSEYDWIQSGLDRIAKNADRFESIAIPPLGCGHGGLDWQRVKTMIERTLGHLPNRIEVYEPRNQHRGSYSVQYNADGSIDSKTLVA